MSNYICKLKSNLIPAKVIARPSKVNKSPYLADIIIEGEDEEEMAHTPALGCCGLVAPGRRVWVAPRDGAQGVSKYVIYCAEEEGQIIGIHPTISNTIVYKMLVKEMIFPEIYELETEVTHGDCRFDIAGMCGNKRVYIEVKCAPIGDIVDCMPRYRLLQLIGAKAAGTKKFAIFPHGNSRKEGTISPRALKHIETMKTIVESGEARCIVVYVTQRTDCHAIKISELDPKYREAVLSASEAGVELMGLAIQWDGSNIYYHGAIPVI